MELIVLRYAVYASAPLFVKRSGCRKARSL